MSLEEIEAAIETLPPEDYRKLREWLAEYEADLWDRQIEADARAGKSDRLVEQVRQSDVRLPLPGTVPRRLGNAKGEFEIPESFWDPLPDELLDAFEGRA